MRTSWGKYTGRLRQRLRLPARRVFRRAGARRDVLPLAFRAAFNLRWPASGRAFFAARSATSKMVRVL